MKFNSSNNIYLLPADIFLDVGVLTNGILLHGDALMLVKTLFSFLEDCNGVEIDLPIPILPRRERWLTGVVSILTSLFHTFRII